MSGATALVWIVAIPSGCIVQAWLDSIKVES